MKIYNYDKITKELLWESEATESPLEPGEYLIPADSTNIKPIEAKARYARCFIDGTWVNVVDNREAEYYLDKEKVEFKLRDKITEEMSLTQFTDIELLKLSIDKKVSEIKQAFSDELKQGFTTISGIKMDATYEAMSFFKDGIEFCEDMGIDVDVRDIYNDNKDVSVAEAKIMLSELKVNYFNNRSKKIAKLNEIDMCKTLEATEAIKW